MKSSDEQFTQEHYLDKAENIYEAVLAIARRARQIGELQKRQIDRYLGQTEALEQAAARARADDSDELPEPEPLDREAPRFEKPVVTALREMKEGQVTYRYEE